MTNISFRKEKLSIDLIGQQRFWIGIAAGVISAISLSLFFNYSREILRSLTGISSDLIILGANELLFFDYFFCLLASVMGLTYTIWIWMGNKNNKRRKDSLYKQLARINAMVMFWIILMVVARIATILPMVLITRPGYDNHLNLFENHWLLFVLIPIVVFMQNWFSVRLVYRARKWIFISFLLCLLAAFTLKMTTTVNQEILNQPYHQRFVSDYNFIDQEIATAAKEYGVEFDAKTIQVLRKWHTDKSVEQIASVKSAFSYDIPISMDTIILQKIIIRNFKTGHSDGHFYRRNSIENWHYALPKDILKQLNYFTNTSSQTKELFEVLKEQIDLVNTPKVDWGRSENDTHTERRRSIGARYNIPNEFIEQLKDVRAKLLEDNQYAVLAKDLPEIGQ